MSLTKKIVSILVLIFLVSAGVIYWKKSGYFFSDKKQNEETQLKNNPSQAGEAASQKEEQKANNESSAEERVAEDWLKKCEAGEEIVLDEKRKIDKEEELIGKIEIDYEENQSSAEYFLVDQSGQKYKFSLSGWAEMDLLEGRKVVLKGEKQTDNFLPFVVRCVTDAGQKNALEYRRKVMAEVEKRINEITGLKGSFVVESFWWRDDEYFYVDFYDEVDEDVFYEALLFAKTKDGQSVFEKVGVFKGSDEEDEWTTLFGKDLFEDTEVEESDENYYEYDELLKAWSPVY